MKKRGMLRIIFAIILAVVCSGCGKKEEAGGIFMQEDLALSCVDGRTLDAEWIRSHDLTVINVWATYCSPCIAELPTLEKIAKADPDRVALTGLLADLYTKDGSVDEAQLSLGKEIMEKSGVSYPVIIADSRMQKSLLSSLQVVPTTFFLDCTGKIIGKEIGSRDEAGWEELIQKYLQKGEKNR